MLFLVKIYYLCMQNRNTIMKENMSEPRIVSSHDVKLDTEYAEWIAEVKHRYRSAQAKAAVKVNAEKLLWNWQMGRDLVQKKAEERWGAGVVEQVSLDLQKEFPGEKGFSAANLWFMKSGISIMLQMKRPKNLNRLLEKCTSLIIKTL